MSTRICELINENCPPGHRIDGDTVEAICELTAYKLMEKRKLPERQKAILDNPYTNGRDQGSH